ncbi:hypothetical protein [Antarcticirhabdus aurantiaca]|uniref:Uncharacterized protein n=1 Tax=Antarcticirhabdus aurantiaca TaxID=2606717 RepID=A0ACD4NL38_9HYPH|nr:hypothetical protein OXU80_22495 [Jeongeuplla avenae]
MTSPAFYLTLYLAIGLWIALTEHRGCRSFTTTSRKRALANIAVMTVGWLPFGAFLAIVIAVAAFVDFSEEEAGL